jgi:hypothetical protein
MIPNKELKKLRAFHNNHQLKVDMVSEIFNHQKQDQIVQGTYGQENGKWRGCAVGCSIHSYNLRYGKDIPTGTHSAYETELGIPASLAHLEDYLFEAMPTEDAVKWPAEFMKAINVGVDLSLVAPKFIAGVLRDVVKGKYVRDDKDVVKSVIDVAILWEKVIAGKKVEPAARSAAESAARSAAESAARSAAWSAAESAARSAAESAAESAAWSAAESAAESAAWSAARSAARSAAESAAWSAARSAARSAAAYKMSRRLLKILRASK